LTGKLFPLAAVVTPNMPEAEFLINEKIVTIDDLKKAADHLYSKYRIPFLAKGGHLDDGAHDVLVDAGGMKVYPRDQVKGVNNHGSGCTFSSAIAAEMAKGAKLREAIQTAKDYLYHGLELGHSLKPGVRVIDHFWRWK